jgi:hypothetical protein
MIVRCFFGNFSPTPARMQLFMNTGDKQPGAIRNHRRGQSELVSSCSLVIISAIMFFVIIIYSLFNYCTFLNSTIIVIVIIIFMTSYSGSCRGPSSTVVA